MRLLPVFALALLLVANVQAPAFARSKAAEYLIGEHVALVCPNGGGEFRSEGIAERDLTGDGKSDLILDYSGILCPDASNGLNDECGAAHCPIQFFVRDGRLLRFDCELTSIGFKIGSGDPPSIHLVNFDYSESETRWNGRTFC